MRWHLRCTFQLFLFGLCTPSRPFIKMFIRKNKNRLHGDHFRITVEPVIVKRYRKTLANRGFYKKKLDTRFDTYCIKTGVQLWRRCRDSNPSDPLGPYRISSPVPKRLSQNRAGQSWSVRPRFFGGVKPFSSGQNPKNGDSTNQIGNARFGEIWHTFLEKCKISCKIIEGRYSG